MTVFINETGTRFLEWMMEVSGGYLDGRNMAATFNMLRANDLLWNYVVHNYLMGQQPPEFDLLFWNADNTRIPGKVHMFLVREFFMKNLLIEPDGIQVKGVGVLKTMKPPKIMGKIELESEKKKVTNLNRSGKSISGLSKYQKKEK